MWPLRLPFSCQWASPHIDSTLPFIHRSNIHNRWYSDQATDWPVKGSNPVKGWRRSLPQNVQTGLLFHGYGGSFPGFQRPGCNVDHSPSSSAEVKKGGGIVKTESDGTSAETRFGLPAKRTSPFISAGVSVQSSNGWTMFWVKLKTAGYPLQSPLSPSLLPCVAVCHQIPFPLYTSTCTRPLSLRGVDRDTFTFTFL